jgi:hypothetical protein
MDYGPDHGNCQLYAQMTRPDTSFAAAGSPKDVAIASGAALLVGAIATAAHDSETMDGCMQAHGWLIADSQAVGPGVAPQVPVSAALLPPPEPTIVDERSEQATRAQQAAEAWLVAQNILNGPGPDKEKRELNTALCNAGDRSACIIAMAMIPRKH